MYLYTNIKYFYWRIVSVWKNTVNCLVEYEKKAIFPDTNLWFSRVGLIKHPLTFFYYTLYDK